MKYSIVKPMLLPLGSPCLVTGLRHYDSEGRVSYTRDLAQGCLTNNDVAFFGAKFPRLVENSRASSLATIPITVVVVSISVV